VQLVCVASTAAAMSPQEVLGKVGTFKPASQWRVAVMVGVGLALAAVPVWMHSRAREGVVNPYAAAKQRTRDERYAWYQSDDMPTK
jgi:hypothetical protein